MRSSTLQYEATTHVRLVPTSKTRNAARGHSYGRNLSDWSSPAGLQKRPWLARLRKALDEERFVVHYQPIVSLKDGGASHYEALVRLADEPSGRLVMPGKFLPAAERYGLVRDIDRLVLSQILRLLGARAEARRSTAQGTRIAVNLSALSVTDPKMLAYIAEGLASHRVDPGLLVIEITETAAISDMTVARAFCEGVSALGCAVALDDFGAGFGSFQYLTRLPCDYLKIDGSFVRNLASSRGDRLIVQALADLARGMGVRTIAEYVTNRATLDLLRDYGVDYAQGYELGRPHSRPAL